MKAEFIGTVDWLSWLEANHKTLYHLLWMEDKAAGGLIFNDPNFNTISYNVAIRARDGNLICKMVCEALNLLQANHCQQVLQTHTP